MRNPALKRFADIVQVIGLKVEITLGKDREESFRGKEVWEAKLLCGQKGYGSWDIVQGYGSTIELALDNLEENLIYNCSKIEIFPEPITGN